MEQKKDIREIAKLIGVKNREVEFLNKNEVKVRSKEGKKQLVEAIMKAAASGAFAAQPYQS